MKKILSLLFTVAVLPAFAGEMGSQETSLGKSYVMIGGGYYSGDYQSNYTNTASGISLQQTFNNKMSNGYGQIGLGTGAQIGSFIFDHQVSVGKLGSSETFDTADSHYSYNQNFDFGYDLMPKMNLLQSVNAYGILGVHYARFLYKKTPFNYLEGTSAFNNQKDQLGFNLGVGLTYQVTSNFVAGVKYQHWQYQSTQIHAINGDSTVVDIEDVTPVFNLVGVELRYYWG